MSGDAHVQFWEGLGVRFPGATQLGWASRPAPSNHFSYRIVPYRTAPALRCILDRV